jgi:hypothetical protein
VRWLQELRLRLRSLVSRARVEQELDVELRFHLDAQIEENLAAGMNPEEARYAALRSIGGRTVRGYTFPVGSARYVHQLVKTPASLEMASQRALWASQALRNMR